MVIDIAGNGIANADVVIYNNDFTFTVATNANGNFSINSMYEGSYEVIAGQWGYITSCDNEYIDGSSSITITLEEGYYDDFTFDFGWTISGNALHLLILGKMESQKEGSLLYGKGHQTMES